MLPTLFLLLLPIAAQQTRFKLVKKLKATVQPNPLTHQDEIGLHEQIVFSALDQQWTGPIKYTKPIKSKEPTPHSLGGETPLFHHLPAENEKPAPDHTDKETVLNFAKLSYNAYYEPSESQKWMPVPGWNISSRFGWENTGLRGYIYEDETESTIIIVVKGTSLATPDNMMFSCCCAKAGWEWRAICDCPKKGGICSKSCLARESNFDGTWYPKTINVWMTGHSLGGALASLVALTNDLPALAFESPGDLLYASRLGLVPEDPTELDLFMDNTRIYHFGNVNDPIFLGQCTGVSSSCYWLDYALESKCHIGRQCTFETHIGMYGEKPVDMRDVFSLDSDEGDEGFSIATVRHHSIEYVIKTYIEPAETVPECRPNHGCLATECPAWTFGEPEGEE